MPDGGDGVRGLVRPAGQRRCENVPRAGGRPRDVTGVDGVDSPVQRPQDLVAARQFGGQRVHQGVQDIDVMDELPDVLVAYGEVRAQQLVEGFVAGGDRVAEVGPGTGGRVDRRIGRGLDEQPHGLTAPRLRCDGHGLVVRVQTLERRAVLVVDQPLRPAAAEVDDRLHPAAGPALGHVGGEAEPSGRPGAATPPLAGDERRVPGAERHVDGYRLARDVPGPDLHREPRGVQRGAQPMIEEMGYSRLSGLPSVMHGRPFLSCR